MSSRVAFVTSCLQKCINTHSTHLNKKKIALQISSGIRWIFVCSKKAYQSFDTGDVSIDMEYLLCYALCYFLVLSIVLYYYKLALVDKKQGV
jgi:hypothetical protein